MAQNVFELFRDQFLLLNTLWWLNWDFGMRYQHQIPSTYRSNARKLMDAGSDAYPVAFHQYTPVPSPNCDVWFIPQAEWMDKEAILACQPAWILYFFIFEVNRTFLTFNIQTDMSILHRMQTWLNLFNSPGPNPLCSTYKVTSWNLWLFTFFKPKHAWTTPGSILARLP